MDSLPLFDEPSEFDRARLHLKLSSLAAENIYIGASSWKYEGWLGQIYSRDRYLVRGRFSEKRFQAECLNEYAATFPKGKRTLLATASWSVLNCEAACTVPLLA